MATYTKTKMTMTTIWISALLKKKRIEQSLRVPDAPLFPA
jgi:hypothetical protein